MSDAAVTKKIIAASFKELCRRRSFDKISITDITDACGLKRQTFYYHFQDIYDLIDWTFVSEADQVIGGKKTYETWQQGFLQVFQAALENKGLILNVYHSISRDVVERYLYDITYDLLIGVVEEQAKGLPVREEDKRFIADFYKFAFVGMVLDWIRRGMKDDPQQMIDRLSILIHGDIARALEKYRTDRPKEKA